MDLIQDFASRFHYMGLVDPTDSANPDTIDYAGRFFLVIYNTSSTISASYATFIVLAISFAIAATFGLLYYGLASGASGFTNFGRRKRRSLLINQKEEEEKDSQERIIANIYNIISEAPDKFGPHLQSKDHYCLLHRLCLISKKRRESIHEKPDHLLSLVDRFSQKDAGSGKIFVDALKVGHNGDEDTCHYLYGSKCGQ